MRRIKSKKGFTLAELLIGLVLFMLLAGAVSSVIVLGFSLYSRSAQRNAAQQAGNTLCELLSSRLCYGVDVTVTNSLPLIEENLGDREMTCIVIPESGDRVSVGSAIPADTDVLGENALAGMRVYARISELSAKKNPVLEIEVEICSESDGRTVYSTLETVRLMNHRSEDVVLPEGETSNRNGDLYIGFADIG